jgi:hypothetical protein
MLLMSGCVLKLAGEQNMRAVPNLRPSTWTGEWIGGVPELHSGGRKYSTVCFRSAGNM